MFDLYMQGREDQVARELQPGDICWVARYLARTRAGRNTVVLSQFTFVGRRQVAVPDAPGGAVWVLDGHLEEQLELPKADAAIHPNFGLFFNVVGHFRRASVLRDD